MPILVFLYESHAYVACFTDTCDNIYCCRLFRIKSNHMPYCDDRIEHRAITARKSIRPGHRLWVGEGVSAADEAQAIGLKENITGFYPVYSHLMKLPRRELGMRAGTTGA